MNRLKTNLNPKKILYIFIILLSLLVLGYNKIIILPFDQLIEKNKNSSSEYPTKNYFIETINNKLHFKLKTGRPEQLMTCISKTDESFDFIKIDKCPYREGENYDPLKSNTYSIVKKMVDSDLSIIKELIKLNINNNEEREISDIQLYFEENCNKSEISLLMNNDIETEDERNLFIMQLKEKKLIDYLILSFDYLSKNKGNLILGNYPHLLKNSPLKKFKLHIINNEYSLKDKYQFRINMDSMFFYKNKEPTNKNLVDLTIIDPIDFIYDSDFIYAGAKYFNNIDDFFFKQYRNLNLCFLETINIKRKMFIIFVCNKKPNSFSSFNIKEFPTLFLYNKKFNYTFNLTYEDLFEEINDKYYFLIAYDSRDTARWRLGKPFLKKYNFVFNAENQTIGFYDKNIIINNQEDGDNNTKEIKVNDTKNLNIIILIVLLVIFNILLIILILNITKKCQQKRKKKIYELNDDEEEDFQYESKKDCKIPINSS